MLSKKMLAALNKQINAETYSAYLYMSIAAYAKSLGLNGFENWFRVQVQEELAHAMKFYDYVNERGGRVTLTAIDAPPSSWKSPLAAFEATLKHEQLVTSLINKLVDLAVAESDHATTNVLQWFVAEQVEEEASADAIRQKLVLVGARGDALYMIDKELAARVFTPPATTGE
jgi:ferritin